MLTTRSRCIAIRHATIVIAITVITDLRCTVIGPGTTVIVGTAFTRHRWTAIRPGITAIAITDTGNSIGCGCRLPTKKDGNRDITITGDGGFRDAG